MKNKLTVSIERLETFRHLLALCNQDAVYCIQNAKSDEDLDGLMVADTQAIKKSEYGARGNVIGTVRLLPLGKNTTIVFDDKDAFHHLPITRKQTQLFRKFQERVKSHFDELGTVDGAQDATTELTAKQAQRAASAGQSETIPSERTMRKRIFGLRIEYLIVGIVLAFFISIFSWFFFPDWARSPFALIVLFSVSFAGATAVVANIRKAYE